MHTQTRAPVFNGLVSVEVFGIWRLSSGLHTVPLGKVHVCHLATDRWKAGLNGTTGCSDTDIALCGVQCVDL